MFSISGSFGTWSWAAKTRSYETLIRGPSYRFFRSAKGTLHGQPWQGSALSLLCRRFPT